MKMARGRMLMLAAGMRAGQNRAQQQAAQAEASKQQGAQEAMAQQQATQAAAPSTEDVIAQIEKLSALHTSCLLYTSDAADE